jgi:hypothetical protein
LLAAKHRRRSSLYLTQLPSSPKKTFLKKWKLRCWWMSNDMSELCVCVCVYVLGTYAIYQCLMNLSHHWLVQWIQGNCQCDRQAFENKGCVTLWPCHLHEKVCILRQKKNQWKLKYFTIQKCNLQNKSSKRKPKSFKILL